jgi:hypothetical protein
MRDARDRFAADQSAADAIIEASRAKLPAGTAPQDVAAGIVTASAILNLDEFLTRH